jgi:hypothetical protein
MTHVRRGITVAVLHVAIVSSLGAKLLIDRTSRPRVWARVAPYDPDLPIRGRYVRLQIEGVPEGVTLTSGGTQVSLDARDGRLVFVPRRSGDRQFAQTRTVRGNGSINVLYEPVAFFIPEHVPDPSIRGAGEELWAEVTVPRRGPPRPIRLGVKKNDVLTPLQ